MPISSIGLIFGVIEEHLHEELDGRSDASMSYTVFSIKRWECRLNITIRDHSFENHSKHKRFKY